MWSHQACEVTWIWILICRWCICALLKSYLQPSGYSPWVPLTDSFLSCYGCPTRKCQSHFYTSDLSRPEFAFTSCPPINPTFFGIKFNRRAQCVFIKFSAFLTIIGMINWRPRRYLQKKPRTILPRLSNSGKDILIPANLPTYFDVRGVVVVGFEPAFFHATTVDVARTMATPPGFLPLVPSTLCTLLYKKIMCPRTMTAELPTT